MSNRAYPAFKAYWKLRAAAARRRGEKRGEGNVVLADQHFRLRDRAMSSRAERIAERLAEQDHPGRLGNCLTCSVDCGCATARVPWPCAPYQRQITILLPLLRAAEELAEAMTESGNAYSCFSGCRAAFARTSNECSDHSYQCKKSRAALAAWEAVLAEIEDQGD